MVSFDDRRQYFVPLIVLRVIFLTCKFPTDSKGELWVRLVSIVQFPHSLGNILYEECPMVYKPIVLKSFLKTRFRIVSLFSFTQFL